MSKLFVTADVHLGHGNIVKYARRPELRPGDLDAMGNWISQAVMEKRAHQMNERLIAKWNSRVKPEDTVIHVGDFCCKGNERGVPGSKTKAKEWLGRLNGTKILLMGNHDDNNGLNTRMVDLRVRLGHYNMLLTHDPKQAKPCETDDVIVCGHVHTAWKSTVHWYPVLVTSEAELRFTQRAFLVVNVGVDVRRYAPLAATELIDIVNTYRRTGELT